MANLHLINRMFKYYRNPVRYLLEIILSTLSKLLLILVKVKLLLVVIIAL